MRKGSRKKRKPVELEWVDRNLCARLPKTVRRALTPGNLASMQVPGKLRTLLNPVLVELANNSNTDGRSRPARKQHAAAVITADGYVFFGNNHRDEDTLFVWCAECAAISIAATYGRSHFVAAFVYSPTYQPFTCDHCKAKLVAARAPNFPTTFVNSKGPNPMPVSEVVGANYRSYSATKFAGDGPVNGTSVQSVPRQNVVRFQLQKSELELAALALKQVPEALRELLEGQLRTILHHSTYFHREESGVAPTAVAVVTKDGWVYCGVNSHFDNPPDCIHALQAAISAAGADGRTEFCLVHFVRENGANQSKQARNPFLGHITMLEQHLEPELRDQVGTLHEAGMLQGDAAIVYGDRVRLYSELAPTF